MHDVRLHLIGGFEVTVDGVSIEGLQPAMQRLLAFVALAPRGVEREFAALQLWPDTTEERARANLRSALWRLRRLPVKLVGDGASRLRLRDDVWVDAHHGVDALTMGDDDGGLERTLPFQSLLSDLLPDWYDEWLTIERERLRQLCVRGIEARAAASLAAGDISAAIQSALTAMSMDPLRESAHRVLIEAHLAEGNEWEARRTLDGYRERIACDPRLRPSAELLALVDGAPLAV
ncbi:MAG: transcriptional regulator [Acidimicrobiia bacterium]|nr:transcriptional regulator [Acidimicrobiia bacterium]